MLRTCALALAVTAVLLLLVTALLAALAVNAYRGALHPLREERPAVLICPAGAELTVRLAPFVGDLISHLRSRGSRLDPSKNGRTSQGRKLSHWGAREPGLSPRLGEAARLVEAFDAGAAAAAALHRAEPLSSANCADEKYCWFFRLYDTEDDFLDWHYDNNFTTGKRYTLILNVYCNAENRSHFLTRARDRAIHVHEAATHTCWLYDGSEVYHAISRQAAGGLRLVLIIPLYESLAYGRGGRALQRLRNLTYKTLAL